MTLGELQGKIPDNLRYSAWPGDFALGRFVLIAGKDEYRYSGNAKG